jgi:hypothetical protein
VRIDVHQHLWTAPFVEALRARSTPPRLVGWTLHLEGEPEYQVAPHDHEIERRLRLNRADGVDLALLSLSSPLGIEFLPAAEAAPLLDAYHQDNPGLPSDPGRLGGFGMWAAACVTQPDPDALGKLLDAGCVGLQLPATALADRAGYERCGPLLRVLEEWDRPLFVHPGAAPPHGDVPPWWPAVVDYVQQMHAACFAFAAYGRPAHPALKVCFAMLAGLAPVHRERVQARGGPQGAGGGVGDPGVWFETSSYREVAIRAVSAAMRPGASGEAPREAERIVLGSDRPYAAPVKLPDEDGAERATRDLFGSWLRSGRSGRRSG